MNIRSVINIRYAQIRSLDLSNGEGIGVALFVQGCRFRCPNCFNPETWDFSGGKEWTPEVEDKLLELASRPYINRLSILGGEPLADENLNDVFDLVNKFRPSLPQKSIWLYTGYTLYFKDRCNKKVLSVKADNNMLDPAIPTVLREKIIEKCDIVVDGRYIDSRRDISLPYRGSKNQRLIDIQKSLQKGEIVLWQT